MKDQDRRTAGRRTRRLTLAAAALASIALGHIGARAQTSQPPGAGTQYRACVDRSWADYNQCLGDAGSWFSRTVCDLAWQADVLYCAAVLKRQLQTGTD